MNLPLPLQFFFLLLVGWVNRHQDDVIAYLKEENRVLKELQGSKRILLNDDQRRRLAVKGKSMVSEEMGLNAFLEEHGIEAIESDLGEYIIQVDKELPSHKKKKKSRKHKNA